MPSPFHRKPKTENRKPPAPEGLPLVAIIGRANVGKSTLFNRLTRSSQALVADLPGVTRDRHYGSVTFDDRTFLLVDTGGLVGGEEELAPWCAARPKRRWPRPTSSSWWPMAGKAPRKATPWWWTTCAAPARPLLLAVNKIDYQGLEANLADFYRFGLDPVYPVSATQGYGLNDLLEAIVQHLPTLPELPAPAPGIRVAVLGRPNVGKSSFINRFLGEERLLVSDTPGTTRDAIDTPLSLEGADYVLVDTAGLRRPSHVDPGLERLMVLKTIKALSRAEVAVLLLDAQEGLTGQDLRIAGLIEDQAKGCLILLNKWDLVPRELQEKTLVKVTDGPGVHGLRPGAAGLGQDRL